MAGGKKDKKKNNQQGRNSGLLDGVMILNLEDFDEEGRSLRSMPSLQRSAGNESGLQGSQQSNEGARKEAEQLSRNKGSVRDQNGPAQQNRAPQEGNEISPEEIAEVSYELDTDAMGMPIISNEIPRNVVAKVMARRAQKNNANSNNNNLISNVSQPANAKAGNKVAVPVQAPPQQAPVRDFPQNPWGFSPNLNTNEDLVAEAPKKKGKKSSSKNAAPQNIMNEEPGMNVEGIQQIQYSTFKPYQKPRTEWSKSAQANHIFWTGFGQTVGKAIFLPASAVGKGLGITGGIKSVAHAKAELGQGNRTHRAIPGREGQFFNPNKITGADILADFRRVPTVWSYLTAAKAEDDEGRPLDPKVSVYIQQPKAESSRTMRFMECGHVMLGIEYTRDSKITGRKERYNIKYGFYPSDRFVDASGTMMMMRGATVPGQLVDDATHTYDISKTYPATTPQIERIAKASEAYTERGGYSMYHRNCTTFVRDMFRAGGIATDMVDRVFTEELMRFNSAGHLGHVIGTSWNIFMDTDLQRKMGNMTTENDLSYQGQGNKLVTKADFDRYRATRNSAGYNTKGLAPAAAGENLRRSTDAEGTFGSYQYAPASLKKESTQDASAANADSLDTLAKAVAGEGRVLFDKINGIMTPEQQRAAGNDFLFWLMNLQTSAGSSITELDRIRADRYRTMLKKDKASAEQAVLSDLVRPNEVRTAYTKLTEEMAEISRYYQTVLGTDSRINTEVMNLLSTMQIALRLINNVYVEMDKSADIGDLGRLREDMMTLGYTVQVGPNLSEMMTPTHYESYLQIFKTPEAAVRNYKRYLEVSRQRNNDKQNMNSIRFSMKWSGKREDEWNELARVETLAKQYDQSHRDMLNKDAFSQKDIDYVFQLRRWERAGAVKATGDMYGDNASASMSYMAIFFEKIFGGMRSMAKRNVGSGGVPNDADVNITAEWMNKYLTRKAQAKVKGLSAIVRGIMNAYEHPTRDLVKGSFRTFFLNAYLRRVFPASRTYGAKIHSIGLSLDAVYDALIDNQRMSFTHTVDSVINLVLAERLQKQEELERAKQAEKQKKKKKKK